MPAMSRNSAGFAIFGLNWPRMRSPLPEVHWLSRIGTDEPDGLTELFFLRVSSFPSRNHGDSHGMRLRSPHIELDYLEKLSTRANQAPSSQKGEQRHIPFTSHMRNGCRILL